MGETLSPELRTHLGGATRRGSAPVIDTQRLNQYAQLNALLHSPRSISPSPTVPEDQSELSHSDPHSEVNDDSPSQSAPPLLRVSTPFEHRRLSDTNISPSSAAISENLTVPVPSGRRHSDLSVLLSLNSKHNHHFAMHKSQACQACLSLLLRSREGSHQRTTVPAHLCPCDFRHQPPSGETNHYKGNGRPRGSSDCSDFSLLQQSLFNIINRKAAPCHTTPSQASQLQFSAVQRPGHSNRDGSLKSHLPSGSLVEEKEPLRNREDRLSAGEQQVSVAVGVVCQTNCYSFPMRRQLLLN